MKTLHASIALAGIALALGCASPSTPPVLSQADAMREAPRVKAAETLAPQAFLHAESLRAQAHAASSEGNHERAGILGEQAMAAYEHAVALARIVTAEGRAQRAEASLLKSTRELKEIDATTQALEAEVLDIELRTRLAEDALPLPTSPAASPERERARKQAALALLSQARLLCVSARLLDPKVQASATEQLDKIQKLESQPDSPGGPLLDSARRSRSACLSLLTEARKPIVRAQPQSYATEELLTELSNAGFEPFRDDRGVVVTVHGPFAPNGALASPAADRMQALSRVAKAHPQLPVLVVFHKAGKTSAWNDAVLSPFRTAGAPEPEVQNVGESLPVALPRQPDARARNERIEIVFITPTP